MTTRHSHEGTPNPLHSLIEPRALLEIAALPAGLPLLASAERGDGHPVLLLPGFLGDEGSLLALKYFLRNRGYDVQTWGLGRNLGFQTRHANALQQKIRFMHFKSGRKVSLVGWSLGGMFALYGAKAAPECVRNIITLGSPVSMGPEGSQSPPLVKAIYRLIAHPLGTHGHLAQPKARDLREQKRMPIPMSCLYSLSDGVIPPQEATIDGDPALHENIRVPGSHLGLAFNAVVLNIVADRLAQAEGDWHPYEPSGLTGRLYRLLTHKSLPL